MKINKTAVEKLLLKLLETTKPKNPDSLFGKLEASRYKMNEKIIKGKIKNAWLSMDTFGQASIRENLIMLGVTDQYLYNEFHVRGLFLDVGTRQEDLQMAKQDMTSIMEMKKIVEEEQDKLKKEQAKHG